jgi:hypothetical protein
VTLRLCEYFPELNAHYVAAPGPRLFHRDLSAQERAAVAKCGRDTCRFVCQSYEWAAEHGCAPIFLVFVSSLAYPFSSFSSLQARGGDSVPTSRVRR